MRFTARTPRQKTALRQKYTATQPAMETKDAKLQAQRHAKDLVEVAKTWRQKVLGIPKCYV